MAKFTQDRMFEMLGDISKTKKPVYKQGGYIYDGGGEVIIDGVTYILYGPNWINKNTGAVVKDEYLKYRLYNAKPNESVAQNPIKPVTIVNKTRIKKIQELKNSPLLDNQKEVKILRETQLKEDLYNPQINPEGHKRPKDGSNFVGTEYDLNKSLDFPMDKAELSAEALNQFIGDEIQADNFRHPNAARYTAEAIANNTGNIPYLSNALGFLGANALGVGHEVSTNLINLFNPETDERPLMLRLQESGEDIYNNYVGAKVGASDMTPREKTNYLTWLSLTNRLPDGTVSGATPEKGTSNNKYFKKDKNDKGQYKSSYADGGGLNKFVGGGLQNISPCQADEYWDGEKCVKRTINYYNADEDLTKNAEYQDWLIRQSLWQYSDLPYNKQRDLYDKIITETKNYNNQKPYDFQGQVSNFYETYPETEDFEKDVNIGPYGSKTKFIESLTNDEAAKHSYRLISDHNQMVDNNAYNYTSNYKPFDKSNAFFQKYPPLSWSYHGELSSNPTIEKFSSNWTNNNFNYIKPNTSLIEDEVNRTYLKKFYPELTDEQIDMWVKENQENPSYITNELDANRRRKWVSGQDAEGNDIAKNRDIFIDKEGLTGYKADKIQTYITQYDDYTPSWAEPKELWLKKEEERLKLPILKPGLIEQEDSELQGVDEDAYNEALENLEAPSYEPVESYNEHFGRTGSLKHKYDIFIPNNLFKMDVGPGGVRYGKNYPIPKFGMKASTMKDPITGETVNKQFRKDRKIQRETGLDRSYYEGSYDEEGKYIPGELENAETEGRRINFQGQYGRKDRKAQEKYNLEYDEYEFRKKFPTLLDELNITYEDYINQNVPKKQYGGLQKFVVGGQPPCGPDEAPDPKTGLCKAIDMTENFPEADVYSKASTRKLQGTLTDKLQQMRNAFQNSRASNMKDGDKYNFGLNLGDETNDVRELPGRIARYKQAIELEKTKYAKDSYTLNQLKQYDPEHWDLKDQSKRFQRKPYEARSAEGLAALRSAVKSGAMSQEDFNYAYNDWGKNVDQNAVQGTGPGAGYNSKDVDWDSKEMNKFTKGLGVGVNALTLGMGAVAAAPIIPMALEAASSGISAFAPVYQTAMSTPILGTANSVVANAAPVTSMIRTALTGNNLIKSYGITKSALGVLDGSIYDANKKVVTDAAKGEFNVGNVATALGKDLGLVSSFSGALPQVSTVGAYVPRAVSDATAGLTLSSPYAINTAIKGVIEANKKLSGIAIKQEGGALLTKKVTCKSCGWTWDAADGGNDVTTCHKCGGQGLVHAQDGINTDAMNGMMKARLAYANEFGNPAAKRMINLPDNPYQFDNGDTGSHYMASMDNYAVPQIQYENGVLQLGDYGPESNEAIRFDSDEDANYFAENYKNVSPGFINQKQYGGLHKFVGGGPTDCKQGEYWNGTKCVPTYGVNPSFSNNALTNNVNGINTKIAETKRKGMVYQSTADDLNKLYKQKADEAKKEAKRKELEAQERERQQQLRTVGSDNTRVDNSIIKNSSVNFQLPYEQAQTITKAQKDVARQIVTNGDFVNYFPEQMDYYLSTENSHRQGGPLTLEELALQQIRTNPDFFQILEEKKYQDFQKREQKTYDNMPWYMKGINTINALASDPLTTLERGLLEWERPLAFQGLQSTDPSIVGDDARFYDRALNRDENVLNNTLNYINPFRAASSAGQNLQQGDYGAAAFDAATIIPMLKAGKYGMMGLNGLMKFGPETIAKRFGSNIIANSSPFVQALANKSTVGNLLTLYGGYEAGAHNFPNAYDAYSKGDWKTGNKELFTGIAMGTPIALEMGAGKAFAKGVQGAKGLYNDVATTLEANSSSKRIPYNAEKNQNTAIIIEQLRYDRYLKINSPEGKRRIEELIANNPHMKNMTYEDVKNGFANMINDNAVQTSMEQDLALLNQRIKNLEANPNANQSQIKRLKKQAESLQGNQFFGEQKIEEKTLGAVIRQKKLRTVSNKSNESNAINLSRDLNPIVTSPSDIWRILASPELTVDDLARIVPHEFGHYFQQGAKTHLDEMLSKISLKTSSSSVSPNLFSNDKGISRFYNSIMKRNDPFYDMSKYWRTGSNGREKTAFMEEVRADMLQRGMIKDLYQTITPELLQDHYLKYMGEVGNKFPLRIYEIMNNNSGNFNIMSEVLNKMPAVVPIGVGGAGMMMMQNNGNNNAPKQKYGGNVKTLSKFIKK